MKQPIPENGTIEVELGPDICFRAPRDLLSRMSQFLLDKRTGNLTINIRDGEIMAFHVHEIVNVGRG